MADLADWVLTRPGIEGITLSGGEPLLQAKGLAALIRQVRELRDLGVVCYTGYTMERTHRLQLPGVCQLLGSIDLLIDGPFRRDLAADLLWRGSRNQRLLCLTDRYRDIVSSLTPETDRSAGLEFVVRNGIVHFTGVPAAGKARSGVL